MVYIGCDHAGYEVKNEIAEYLKENNIEYKDLGCNGEKVDYPVIAEKLCSEVLNDIDNNKGILICGTGIGMSIAANKIKGIRAAHCTDEYSAKYTRLHNDANVLCMGARITGSGLALEITETFLRTEFEGGRHQRRVDLITELEEV